MMRTLLFTFLLAGCMAPEPATWTAMTFNIRFDNPGDGVDAWPNRKDRVAGIIREGSGDIVGLQEALRSQIDSLAAMLPGYEWIGVGRDDGADGGEYSPIFFRSDRLQIGESGTFWLSPTPDSVGSRGWDAALPRVATWAVFKARESNTRFLALNTHFDHRGDVARLQSARLIRRWLSEWTLPVVVMGDFNAVDSTQAFQALVGPDASGSLLTEAGCGTDATFTGFEVGAFDGTRIDYVLGGAGVQFDGCQVIDTARDGRYASDHLPVVARFTLPR